MKKEIEALYYLKKYRAMRERYGALPSAEVESAGVTATPVGATPVGQHRA